MCNCKKCVYYGEVMECFKGFIEWAGDTNYDGIIYNTSILNDQPEVKEECKFIEATLWYKIKKWWKEL